VPRPLFHLELIRCSLVKERKRRRCKSGVGAYMIASSRATSAPFIAPAAEQSNCNRPFLLCLQPRTAPWRQRPASPRGHAPTLPVTLCRPLPSHHRRRGCQPGAPPSRHALVASLPRPSFASTVAGSVSVVGLWYSHSSRFPSPGLSFAGTATAAACSVSMST
jgi:hypothetical protein